MENKKKGKVRKVRVNDFLFAYDNKTKVVEETIRLASEIRGSYVIITDVSGFSLATRDKQSIDAFSKAALIVSDSNVLQRLISKKKKLPFIKVAYGPDLMRAICAAASQKNLNIGLFGCQTDYEMQALVSNLKQEIPALKITYTQSPPIQRVERFDAEQISHEVTLKNVDILFVGLGAPKQNILMRRMQDTSRFMSVGIGGAFDFNSGRVKRSPKIIHEMGLEWLYRLFVEPKRLWRRVLGNFLGIIQTYNNI